MDRYLPVIAAPRGALTYPQLRWEELGGTFLGLMPYPAAERLWGQQHGSKAVDIVKALKVGRCGTRATR
jgi:hypothetical protein